jgi:glycosyltransferase involved in cell wall biosynthesis
MLVRKLIDSRNRALKETWVRLVERRNLAGAAAIHLTSEEERRELTELGCALAPTVVIPNGVDVPMAYSPAAVSADIRELICRGFDILSFGRISWKKALDRVISALTELPEASALIAGNGEEKEVARLQRLAADLGVTSRVRFLARHIDGADKEALFASARVFALPSLSENFGNVVAEAMVRGLPVLVTEGVGTAELVRESNAGLTASNEPGAFAAALRQLLGSRDWSASLGAAGAAYARQHLCWNRIADLFADLYREISTAHRASSIRHGVTE